MLRFAKILFAIYLITNVCKDTVKYDIKNYIINFLLVIVVKKFSINY